MSKLQILLFAMCVGLTVVIWATFPLSYGKMVNLTKPWAYLHTSESMHKPVPDYLDSVEVDQLSKNTSAEVVLRFNLREYRNKIYKVPTTLEQCTVVIQTYKRIPILPRVISHFCTVVIFHKVLIIWNEVDTAVPASLIKIAEMCSTPVKFIFPKENRLTNKFVPRKEIETDCVYMTDDDRIVDARDINFGFDVWRNFRHRLVGFEERSIIPGPNHTFKYGFHQINPSDDRSSKSYSIILMGGCFTHKAYLNMYFDPDMNPMSVLDYVNKEMNCEDILLSVLVTKFLQDIGQSQCGVLKVTAKHPIINLDSDKSLKGNPGLRSRKNHYKFRSVCLNKFAEIFGSPPLKTTRIVVIEDIVED